MEIIQKISIYLSKDPALTDNLVFRMHYKFTISLLVLFSAFATSTQYFGTPIECTSSKTNVNKDFINNFCWIHPTFIVITSMQDKSTHFQNMPHYGIANSATSESKQFNSYYQWIGVSLLVQAIILYLPRFLWKFYEQRIVKNLMLEEKMDLLDEEKQHRMCAYIIHLLKNHPNLCGNFQYFVLVLLESLNLLIVLGQFAFMSYFLNMNFREYGWKVWNFEEWSYEYYFDPMTKAFPKMTKCLFSDYGPSGDVSKNDYFCVLPLNAINEKIYLVLWLWYQTLIVCSVINLLHRFLLSFSRGLRVSLTLSRLYKHRDQKISAIVSHATIGQWYILDVLSMNLNATLFHRVETSIDQLLVVRKQDENYNEI